MKKWLLCCCLLLALPLAAQAEDEKIDPANYICAEFVAQGLTHRKMAEVLNERGIAAAKGGLWTHGQVQRILNRYADWAKAGE